MLKVYPFLTLPFVSYPSVYICYLMEMIQIVVAALTDPPSPAKRLRPCCVLGFRASSGSAATAH